MEDRSVLGRAAPVPSFALPSADVYFARPAVMLIHGGFWRPDYDRTHLRPMASALAAQGWDVISIEYRREPGNPDATLLDVRAAVESLDKEVIVVGHSAGGHLALWACALLRLKALALAPVADLIMAEELDLDGGAVRDFLGVPAASRPDLDPIQLPPSRAVLIHGDQDTIVPIGLSSAYAAAHPDSRLVVAAGVGHFELIDPLSNAWPIVIQELERLLA